MLAETLADSINEFLAGFPPLLTHLMLFFLGCLILMICMQILIRSVSGIGEYFHMTDFVIGFVIVALASSAPELFIGVAAAVSQNPDLAFGMVVGSSIINLTLVVGVLAILKGGIRIDTKAVRTDSVFMFLTALLPLAMILVDGAIDRFDGFLLLAAFALYGVRLYSQRRQFHDHNSDEISYDVFLRNCVFFVLAITGFFISANLIVTHSTAISYGLLSPPFLVGLFLVSMWTALPELLFGARAIIMKHRYLAFGSIIGSVIANNSLVLGLVAFLSPVAIEPSSVVFTISAFFMIVAALIYTVFVSMEKRISWEEGIVLVVLYVIFAVVVLNLWVLESATSVIPAI